MDPTPKGIYEAKVQQKASLCSDTLLPPIAPITTTTLTVLGPDGFAAGQKTSYINYYFLRYQGESNRTAFTAEEEEETDHEPNRPPLTYGGEFYEWEKFEGEEKKYFFAKLSPIV